MTIRELYRLETGDKIILSRSLQYNSKLYKRGTIGSVYAFRRDPLRVLIEIEEDFEVIVFVLAGGGFKDFERYQEDVN
jgi:hypothetical protein